MPAHSPLALLSMRLVTRETLRALPSMAPSQLAL
jgi:hypothetical protein